MSARFPAYLLTLAVTSLVLLNQSQGSEIIVENSELDVSFLSRLRYELRKAPKLAQCLQYWKVLDLKLHGEPKPDMRPVLEQADTRLLEAVSSAMRSRKPIFGTNSLVEYLDDCVIVIDGEIERTGCIRNSHHNDDLSEEINEGPTCVQQQEQVKGPLTREQELENQVQKLKRQLDLERKSVKSTDTVQLVEQVNSLKSELSQINDINRSLLAQYDLAMKDLDEDSIFNDKDHTALREKLKEELERLEQRRKNDEKVDQDSSDLKKMLRMQNLRIQVMESEIRRLERHSNLQTQVLNTWRGEKELLKTKVKGGTELLAQLEATNYQLRSQVDKSGKAELDDNDIKEQAKDLSRLPVIGRQISGFRRLFKL